MTDQRKYPLELAIKVSAQEGMAYRDLVRLARQAEDLGYAAFLRSDHWLPLTEPLDRPVTDAWTSLAGIARETTRIRLGSLVSPVAFRHPVGLAKIVATVDEISEGRAELGLGAGWYRPEHDRFGLPFGTPRKRFDMLEEQLEVVTKLWSGEPVTFAGTYYQLMAVACLPKPKQQPPPLVIGTAGGTRAIALAVKYGTEINLDYVTPETCKEALARIDRATAEVERPHPLRRSVMVPAREVAGNPSLLGAYLALGIDRLVLDIGTGEDDTPARLVRSLARELQGLTAG
jgi:F420-dependent oxidoreductase-like protein